MRATREQWMIGTALSGVVNAINAPFCSLDCEPEAVNSDPEYVEAVAFTISKTSSRMQVESAITVLNAALKRLE